jgi:hypothetical protein
MCSSIHLLSQLPLLGFFIFHFVIIQPTVDGSLLSSRTLDSPFHPSIHPVKYQTLNVPTNDAKCLCLCVLPDEFRSAIANHTQWMATRKTMTFSSG